MIKRYLLLFLFLASCVDPYDPKLVGGEKYLVFEGTLTDAPGPYRFALTLSAGYNSTESVYEERVQGAKIWVTDEQGTRTDFIDDGLGNFDSPAGFRGKVGNEYFLTIQYDSQTYRSDPELLRPVPPIDTVYSSFRRITTSGTKISGEFLVYVDVNDPPGENYYQWDWTHYYRPTGCLFENLQWRRCCSRCWNIVRSSGQIHIATDRIVEGRRLTGQQIAVAPYDNASPYYLIIGQQSLSRSAYQYWLAVRNLTGNVGSVFDIPPATLVGNLYPEKPGSRRILGYFQVSSRVEKIVYISRNLAPVQPFAPTIWPFNPVCYPCDEGLYRTGIQPEEWRE